jgi:hypothetical protein
MRFVLQLNLEENDEESDSDSNRFLMSSLSEAQLMDMKNEGKVHCVCNRHRMADVTYIVRIYIHPTHSFLVHVTRQYLVNNTALQLHYYFA